MKKLFENFRKSLQEDVYSEEMHSFIQFSYELDNAGISGGQKVRRLEQFLKNNNFKFLGTGVDRQAWKSPNGEIVKLVNDAAAHMVAANKKELERFNRSDIEVFPRIEAYDDKDYFWFVVEEVTQIGDKNTTQKFEKLFPKLMETLYAIRKAKEDIGHSTRKESKWFFPTALMALLKFIWGKKKGVEEYGALDDIEALRIFSGISQFGLGQSIPGKEKVHKYAMDRMYEYLKNPDKNFARLARAVVDADMSPVDLHYNNLAYDEDWNIKVLDAG